jgi:hypothetical protein
MACRENWGSGSHFNDKNVMYSFDASDVFNSKSFLSGGSHGDLRSDEKMDYCTEKGISNDGQRKINGTFNFVLKFINGFDSL